MKKELAKIKNARLEIQGKGILSFNIYVDYEDRTSQDIGGLTLDGYDKKQKKRIGTAYGCEMIRQLLLVLGVDDFNEMEGKYIYVLTGGESMCKKTLGIETLHIDGEVRRIIFKDIATEFLNTLID